MTFVARRILLAYALIENRLQFFPRWNSIKENPISGLDCRQPTSSLTTQKSDSVTVQAVTLAGGN